LPISGKQINPHFVSLRLSANLLKGQLSAFYPDLVIITGNGVVLFLAEIFAGSAKGNKLRSD